QSLATLLSTRFRLWDRRRVARFRRIGIGLRNRNRPWLRCLRVWHRLGHLLGSNTTVGAILAGPEVPEAGEATTRRKTLLLNHFSTVEHRSLFVTRKFTFLRKRTGACCCVVRALAAVLTNFRTIDVEALKSSFVFISLGICPQEQHRCFT